LGYDPVFMDLVPLLQALVRIDSTSSRPNGQVLDLLEAQVRPLGFEVRRLRWSDADGVQKENLVCRRGPEQAGGLAFIGHTDCVPFDPEWREALQAPLRDGAVWGRGTADTKGFLAAAVTAAARTAAGRLPLTLLFTADEEVGCLGAKQALAEGRVRPRHAIVGEPTGLVPVRAHKGYCSVDVEIGGVEGHSAYPEVGASAIHATGRLLGELEAIGAVLKEQPDPGFDPPYTTWNVGVIQGGKARNIIAGQCRFTYEWRPLPGQDPRQALRLLEAACQRLAEAGGGRITATVGPLRSDAAAVTSPEAALVRFLEAESGHPSTTVPFGTELPEVSAMGAEGVVFGAGDIRVAHRTGEHVRVDELHRCADILTRTVEKFCG
jgi:acetylornithine deacetylase